MRKAFQDMEAALRENRMTLEAIRVTQSDRDLFKHLISEATNYVAADYMRHANERRIHLDQALEYRRELFTSCKQLVAEQYKHVEMARELGEHNGAEGGSGSRLPGGQRSPEPGADRAASAGKKSSAMKPIWMSCKFVLKSKMKWWPEAAGIAGRERSPRGSRRAGSG